MTARQTPLPTHLTYRARRIQGVGAKSATVAQAVEQVPSPALHPTMAAGAASAKTVPNVNPAAE